jgi:hypothetical protein
MHVTVDTVSREKEEAETIMKETLMENTSLRSQATRTLKLVDDLEALNTRLRQKLRESEDREKGDDAPSLMPRPDDDESDPDDAPGPSGGRGARGRCRWQDTWKPQTGTHKGKRKGKSGRKGKGKTSMESLAGALRQGAWTRSLSPQAVGLTDLEEEERAATGPEEDASSLDFDWGWSGRDFGMDVVQHDNQ